MMAEHQDDDDIHEAAEDQEQADGQGERKQLLGGAGKKVALKQDEP
jgi:hypothetical protein